MVLLSKLAKRVYKLCYNKLDFEVEYVTAPVFEATFPPSLEPPNLL